MPPDEHAALAGLLVKLLGNLSRLAADPQVFVQMRPEQRRRLSLSVAQALAQTPTILRHAAASKQPGSSRQPGSGGDGQLGNHGHQPGSGSSAPLGTGQPGNSSSFGALADAARGLCRTFDLVDLLIASDSDGGSMSAGTQWCSSAASALQAVPLLTQQQQQQQQQQQEHDGADGTQQDASLVPVLHAILVLASNAWDVCLAVEKEAVKCMTQEACAQSASELAAAAAALWRLHTVSCRMVAWAAGGGGTGVHVESAAGLLLETLCTCLEATQAFLRRDDADEPTLTRQLQAMSVGHLAAVQALSECFDMTLLDRWSWLIVGESLALAAGYGPPGLGADSALQGLLDRALTRPCFIQVRDPADRAGNYSRLLEHAGRCPRLMAHLLLHGHVSRWLQDAEGVCAAACAGTGAVPYSRQVDMLVNTLLGAVRSLLTAAQAALTVEQHRADATTSAFVTAVRAALAGYNEDLNKDGDQHVLISTIRRTKLPPLQRLAKAMQQHWQRTEQQQADALALVQAAAARSCAYLRCANVEQEGGPATGQGAGSKKCIGCRVCWYCDTACACKNWRGPGGHKRCCAALAAARAAEKAAAAAARAAEKAAAAAAAAAAAQQQETA